MSVELGAAADRLEPREECFCPACGEECGADATWCNYFGEGRVPITPVRVRWTAEVIDAEGAVA